MTRLAFAMLPLALVGCAGSGATTRQLSSGHRATMSALGFTPVVEPREGSITRGGGDRVAVPLHGGNCYRVVALGEGSGLDLEVALVAPNGQRSAASTTSGPAASARYCPTNDGAFAATLAARSGSGTYLFGVWQDRETGASEAPSSGERGTCEVPYVLDFGHPVEGTTANARDNASGTCLRGRGPDVVYTLTVPTRRRVTITVRTDFDAALYLQHECGHEASAEISCCNLAVVRGVSRIDTVLDAGSYFVVVDSASDGRRGRFTLVAEAGEAPELAQVCASLPTLTPSTPGHATAPVHASTAGRPDLMRGSCADGRFPGPDQAYALALIEPSRLRAMVTADGNWDTGLYLRRSCTAEDTEVACNDNAEDLVHARIARSLDAGQYTLVVDGVQAGSQGEFDLAVETAPADGSGIENDACNTAAPIEAGATVHGDTFAARDDVAGSCGGEGASDAVYRVHVPRRARLVAELEASGLGEVPGTSRLYLTRACGNPHAELGCAAGRVDAVVPPGSYDLVVDGGDRNAFGRYVLHTSLEDAAGIDAACRNVPALTAGRSVSGRTRGADRLHASCGGHAQSAEQVYAFRLTERRHVLIDVDAEFDSVLSLRTACERESSELACNDDFRGPRASRVETDLEPGTYYAIVDGFHQGNEGAFTIHLTTSEPSATPPVASPPPPPGPAHTPAPSVPVAPNPCHGRSAQGTRQHGDA